jgi:hypothetical protein
MPTTKLKDRLSHYLYAGMIVAFTIIITECIGYRDWFALSGWLCALAATVSHVFSEQRRMREWRQIAEERHGIVEGWKVLERETSKLHELQKEINGKLDNTATL